jgi:hypothetical protein
MISIHTKFTFLSQLFNELDNRGFDTASARGIVPNILRSTVDGSDRSIITPFGEDYGPEKLLEDWSRIFDTSSSNFPDQLLELEASQKLKYGPRSIQIDWVSRRDSVKEYFDTPDLDSDIINIAAKHSKKSATLKSLRTGGLRALSKDNAMLLLKNSTNSGLPSVAKKGTVKEFTINKYDELVSAYEDGLLPCLLFTRTQEQKKTRAVWGYPMIQTLREMTFYSPYLKLERTFPWRAALNGPDAVDNGIKRIFTESKSSETFVSIDFSAYDASINHQLIKLSFDQFIKEFFQKQYHDELINLASNISTIGLLTPEGIWEGSHGVPSGCTFTNAVDSVVQYLVTNSLRESLEDSVVDRIIDSCQIQGDDGAYLVPDEHLDVFLKHFTKFGLKVNIEKSYQSKNHIIYLQNLYVKDVYETGVYPIYRALNRLVYQERFTEFSKADLTGKDYFGIRAISILENCKNHPLHEEFVKFVQNNNKYSLLPSKTGLAKYNKWNSESNGADDIIVHQYGQDIKGLMSFKTVKILQSM